MFETSLPNLSTNAMTKHLWSAFLKDSSHIFCVEQFYRGFVPFEQKYSRHLFSKCKSNKQHGSLVGIWLLSNVRLICGEPPIAVYKFRFCWVWPGLFFRITPSSAKSNQWSSLILLSIKSVSIGSAVGRPWFHVHRVQPFTLDWKIIQKKFISTPFSNRFQKFLAWCTVFYVQTIALA